MNENLECLSIEMLEARWAEEIKRRRITVQNIIVINQAHIDTIHQSDVKIDHIENVDTIGKK